MRLGIPLLAGVVLLAGCGGGTRLGGKLPHCADHPSHRYGRGALPSGFPLPEGTLLTKLNKKFDRVNFRGRFPGDVNHARAFFQQRLPEEGFVLNGGDSKGGFAEESFVGNGVRGFVKVHRYEPCEGVVRMLLTVKS